MGAEDIVLSADADWLDGPRWTDELCDDLFDAMGEEGAFHVGKLLCPAVRLLSQFS